jgi:septal ring factor EnvC (AmiA/AmiB activator)
MPWASTSDEGPGAPASLPAGPPAFSWRLIVLVVLLALIMPMARSQTPREADLDRLRGEITRLKKRLEHVRSEARTAQQELEEADLELDIRSRELDIAVDAQQQLERERHEIEAQIAALQPRIRRQKTFLEKRLNALYRFGGLSYLRMFLAIDDRRDPLEAMSLLTYLVSRDARAVSRFQIEQQQLSLRNLDLADRMRRLQEMQAIVEERRRLVASAHTRQARLLTSLHAEESGGQKQLAGLEERARRLERLIDTLSKLPSTGLAGVTDIRTVQGALGWPIPGKVVEPFGRQRNAKFATVTINNGVKIAAAPGAPVHAVFGGTVLFSQWFKGYGNLIIVDHGNRVFSLYGNLKAPAVAVGDRVAAGQAIAGVGESDDARSGYLYFEIRQDNKPEDPQQWLSEPLERKR